MNEYIDRFGKRINKKYNEVIKLTQDLVKIHSHYYNEQEVMVFAKEWLISQGLPVYVHEYQEKNVINFAGHNVLCNVSGGKEGPTICLNGHLDTVRLTKGWSIDAYEASIIDGKIYGLGALDMKSGSAAIMIALRNFVRKHPVFNGKIILALVSDEEGPFGLGTNALIEDGYLVDIDCALVAEPSAAFVGKEFPILCLGAKGTVVYQVEFYGKASHAAMPEAGINAAVDASKFIVAANKQVPKIQNNLGTGRICPLSIEADGGACSVPEYAKVVIHRHIVLGEDVAYVLNEAKEIINLIKPKSEYKIALRSAPSNDCLYYKPYIISEDNEYVSIMQEASKNILSITPAIDYLASIGDFNYLGTRLGKVPVLVFGPDGDNIHQSDEYVYLDTIGKTSDVVEEFLELALL